MTKLCSRCNTNPATGRALCNACRDGCRMIMAAVAQYLAERLRGGKA